ncbi:MAG TPA: sensor domain-containing diguanylate cyclase [Chitinolyticbacter sp.]|nr:sensor domain-containing diguanylate cyclase [Chitinolyticbacter sp.]
MPSKTQLLKIIEIQTEISKLGFDLGEVMALVVERTVTLIGADGAIIELAEGDEMVYRATSGLATPHLGLRIKQANSLSGECIRSGNFLRCDDSETDPRVDREACRQVGLRSMLVWPLKHQGTTVGVLKAVSALPNSFGKADEELLTLLTEVIGAAMYFATKYADNDLFHQATHDNLTNLANRSLFMDRLRNVLLRSTREQRAAGLLMIDMDGLKQINDTYGHRAGDAALKELAQRIQRASRQSDLVARLGGDEFAVVLAPVDAPDGVERAVQRLQLAIAPPFSFDEAKLCLRASIGAAQFPGDSEQLENLLEIADQRMYQIKRARSSQPERATLH